MGCLNASPPTGVRTLLFDTGRGRRQNVSGRYRLRGCDDIGEGVILHGTPYIHNLGYISVGSCVELRSSPVVSHLVTGPDGRIEIGRGARIAHGAAIAAYAGVRIGSGAQIGPFVMIMDTDFHEAGKHEARGGTAPIYIGDNARLGSRVTVLRGANIGAGAIVAAGSVVSGEIAPGARVSGVPARLQNTSDAVRETLPLSVESVLSVVARTFGLRSLPRRSTKRDEIAAWDSLGSLNLLLALEEAFDLTLSQQDVVEIETIDDVFSAVSRAFRRASARWHDQDDSFLEASSRVTGSLSRA